MKKILLFSLILLFSCGDKKDKKKPDPIPDTKTLEMIADEKVDQLTQRLDPISGWAGARGCDALLWNGKLLAVEAFSDVVNVHIAEYEGNGRYNRREAPPCYDPNKIPSDQGSSSTTSNDMYLGLLIGLYTTKNIEALERIAEYGEHHNWIMGDPFPQGADRVVFRPNLIGLLGRMLYALSEGEIDKTYRYWPSIYFVSEKSYQRHLTALGIYIQDEVQEAMMPKIKISKGRDYYNKILTFLKKELGDQHSVVKEWESAKLTEEDNFSEISNGKFSVLKGLTEKEPENPLFWVIRGLYEGNMDMATALLEDPSTEKPHYVRGEDVEALWLVEWLFAYEILRKSIL